MDGRKKGVDAQGNLFLSGRVNSASDYLLVSRYAPDGQSVWSNEVVGLITQNTLNRGSIGFAAIALDAGGNVYAVSSDNSPAISQTRKYSPGGQLLWQRSYAAGVLATGRAVVAGNSGGVYVLMGVQDGGYSGTTVLVVKYSDSGTFQWSRNVDIAGPSFSIGLDATESVYVGTADRFAKINSAGALQWAVQQTAGLGLNCYRMAVSGSGNIYAVGDLGPGPGAALCAFDPSGSFVWARTLSSGALGDWWNDVVLSGQSLYCIGVTGPSSNDILLAEYDINGTLKWQRRISGAGTNQGFSLADIDANNLAIFGTTGVGGASGDVFIGRIPKSGPPVGRIGPFTVSASSLTPSSNTLTFATFSPANQTVGAATADTYSDSAVLMPTNLYPF
jgi:hypothetical protein